jgi:predicted permease
MPLWGWLDDVGQDLAYAIRQFRRSPGFFALAILLIGAGIGANTLIFTLVDAVFLRPLPVRTPQSLVELFVLLPNLPPQPGFSWDAYHQVAEHSSTLFDVVGQTEIDVAMERGSYAERARSQGVTENYFEALGVSAFRGRVFGARDRNVAVLSYDCWVRNFGRDPNALGQVVRLEGHPFQIVGVTPKEFNGTTLDNGPDIRVLFRDSRDFLTRPGEGYTNTEIIARLRPGFTLAQAQEEASVFMNRANEEMIARVARNPATAALAQAFRRSFSNARYELQRIDHGVSWLRTQLQTALLALLAGTGLLLLMVCSNVSGLLLARAASREKETAIRLAIGASRARIIRQWLTESLFLTILGGVVGLLLVWLGMPLLASAIPPVRSATGGLRPVSIDLHPDFRIIVCCAFACGLTAILSGLAPAWRASRHDPQTALKTTVSDPRQRRMQAALCAFQIALCMMLLVSDGLLIRTLINLRELNPGFDRDHVVTFEINPEMGHHTGEQSALFAHRLVERARALPGVAAAGLSARPVMQGIGAGITVVLPGQRLDSPTRVNTSVNAISAGYFDAMGIHLIAGRDFRDNESIGSNKGLQPVIVNEAFARRFFHGQNPVGRQFATGTEFVKPDFEIVGEVGDAKYRSLREIVPPVFYSLWFGGRISQGTFVLNIRTQGDPYALIRPVRTLVQSLEPGIPIFRTATMAEEIDRLLGPERLIVVLASGFAISAIALSMIGLYGMLAYYVTGRRREIGLRIALGAQRTHIMWFVSKRLFKIVIVGGAAGTIGCFFAGAWIRSLLYGIRLLDPVSISATLALILLAAFGAAAIPMFRAIRVDAAFSLKQE